MPVEAISLKPAFIFEEHDFASIAVIKCAWHGNVWLSSRIVVINIALISRSLMRQIIDESNCWAFDDAQLVAPAISAKSANGRRKSCAKMHNI